MKNYQQIHNEEIDIALCLCFFIFEFYCFVEVVFAIQSMKTPFQEQQINKQIKKNKRITRRKFRLFQQRYKHVRYLGYGAYGTVSLVTHRRTHRQFAMKKIRYNLVEKVPEEVKYLKLLNGTNIGPDFQDFCIDRSSGKCYIVMQYFNYGTWHNRRCKLDAKIRTRIETEIRTKHQLLETEYGIYHGDMHNNNIMLHQNRRTRTIEPFLIDFGLSYTKVSFVSI